MSFHLLNYIYNVHVHSGDNEVCAVTEVMVLLLVIGPVGGITSDLQPSNNMTLRHRTYVGCRQSYVGCPSLHYSVHDLVGYLRTE